ncbi:MAG: DUF4340 domain-containing protein [Woeseiaceae bacterium]
MNKSTLRLLGIIVAVLIAALLLIESGDDGDLPEAGSLLFPEMRAVANDIDRIAIIRTGDTTVVEKREGTWILPGRGNYAANITKVREVLLAMSDATVVEAKTANPDLHGRLGVDAPDDEASKGTSVTATSGDQSFELVFGNVAQQNFRYARVAGEDQSWLIDQNPDIPTETGQWLNTDIIDINSNRIRSVSIVHPDEESISIRKDSDAETDFTVAEIPAGRELSYSTVANGIGGALNDLDLDDVRLHSEPSESVVARFETFDNVRINVNVSSEDDSKWMSLEIHLPADVAIDGVEEWTAARDRVAGWQYKIADYKANLFTRRWEDILKPLEAEPVAE